MDARTPGRADNARGLGSRERTGAAAASATTLAFPDGFLWGVATAAHQYEGGNTNNQWYAWEQAGHIKNGDSCGLACNWWQHAEPDFDLARDMGLKALRLSVEWSRIEPRPGEWDESALDRYRWMLAGLRERGIEPMVTLHHFTNPLWLEARGGFLAPVSVDLFARFVGRTVEALGDLCDLWCTINEPNVYAIAGWAAGMFPPGRTGQVRAAIRVQSNMARAHAAAYTVIHRLQPAARVGWAQNYNMFDPAHPGSSADRLMAGIFDAVYNDFFPRAVRSGRAAAPLSLLAGDLSAARGTYDYVGINLYYRDQVAFDLRQPRTLFSRRYALPGSPQGDDGREPVYSEVHPAAIRRVAERMRPLGKPIYVTENGLADPRDRLRPWQIVSAVRELHGAISAGIDLRGYFYWSLLDNFEWSEGWRMRFGLVALDPATQVRTPRPSAALYSAIAHANALTAQMVRELAPGALGALAERPAQAEGTPLQT
jgi:beta-glucosidase